MFLIDGYAFFRSVGVQKMLRIASKIRATLKWKSLSLWEQILSFKSSLYGKEKRYVNVNM